MQALFGVHMSTIVGKIYVPIKQQHLLFYLAVFTPFKYDRVQGLKCLMRVCSTKGKLTQIQ